MQVLSFVLLDKEVLIPRNTVLNNRNFSKRLFQEENYLQFIEDLPTTDIKQTAVFWVQ